MKEPILGIDSSGKTAGVCVWFGGRAQFEKTLQEGLTHSQTLLPLVQEALAQTGLAVAGLGGIAVTVGPGSFTGLRIGMALTKGLALPCNIPAVGVSTLAAWGHAAANDGIEALVVPALDARRGEVYWAAFAVTAGGVKRLAPDAVGPVAELAPLLHAANGPICFVGDGADLCYNNYTCAENLQLLPKPALQTGVGTGAVLAALHKKGAAAGQMAPQYLRLSQAQRQRKEQLARIAKEEAPCQEP